MDYIVMDLEWNQCPYGKNHEVQQMPFEIIEIGAVKLDAELNVVDEYRQFIKPKVYRKLHYKVQEITHLTIGELKNGVNFKHAIYEFLEWCGDDYRFVTWGTMDLKELQRNMKYYHLERILDFPLIFDDLQKMFSLCYEDGRNKRTLSSAVDYLGIEVSEQFHQAIDDARYTAKVMQVMDYEKVKDFYSIDTFYLPRIKEEEIYATFENYTKFVSRELMDKEAVFEDAEISSMRCNKCNCDLERKLDWFSDGMKTYFSVGWCPEHGYVRGKLKIKNADEDTYYAIKILKSTDEAGVKKIEEKQEAIREKRRERRLKERMEMRLARGLSEELVDDDIDTIDDMDDYIEEEITESIDGDINDLEIDD